MSEKNLSLLRPFTSAEGELPCDPLDGEALSPLELRLLSLFGYSHAARVLPMAWLDGKPVYPDSLICWGNGTPHRADNFVGLNTPTFEGWFSWPVEEEKTLPPKTYNVVILIDGEVNYKTKALPGDVITTYIKSE